MAGGSIIINIQLLIILIIIIKVYKPLEFNFFVKLIYGIDILPSIYSCLTQRI